MTNARYKDKKLKISIVEDSPIHVEWLRLLILEQENLELTDVDSHGKDAIISAKKSHPDLVLVDFQLKDMTGLEVSRRIKAHTPNTKIFILTAHTEISIIERLIEDKHVDAIGIKGSSYFEDNFISALRRVCDGESYIDPSLLGKIRLPDSISDLTKREFEILVQTGMGKSDNKIAEDLNVEISHVKNLKSKVAKKTNREKIAALLNKLVENA